MKYAIDLRDAIYAIQWALIKIQEKEGDLSFKRAHIELSIEFNGASGVEAKHNVVTFAHALNTDSVSKIKMTMLPMAEAFVSGIAPDSVLATMAASIVDATQYARLASSGLVALEEGSNEVTLAIVIAEDSRIVVASPEIMKEINSVLAQDREQGKVVVPNSITIVFADGHEAEASAPSRSFRTR